MRILVLGASGMLGHVLFRETTCAGLDVWGTVRTKANLGAIFSPEMQSHLFDGVDAYDFASIVRAVDTANPTVIVNCVGLIRQIPEGRQPLPCIEINARLPHLLLALCKQRDIRLIHYSTDCVFDGKKGAPYMESDSPSATDIYGLSKYLGELHDAPGLTIRTSIIGHEIKGKFGLLEWFLAQSGTVKGYRKALFTGLPTTEQARILRDYILPNPALIGVYQVAAQPVSKYELLRLFADVYGKDTCVEPDDTVGEDKRLCADAFLAATGYSAPNWRTLVTEMRRHQ